MENVSSKWRDNSPRTKKHRDKGQTEMNIDYISFNKIFVIESLTKDFTGKALYDEIINVRQFQIPDEFTCEYFDISSRQEFTDLLDSILIEVRTKNIVPVFHFEIHGSTKGLVLKKDDFIEWQFLVEYFRTINSVTKNNLLVTFATCHSSYLLEEVDLTKKCPFWSFVSTHKTLSNEDIEISYHAFYDALLTKRSIETAVSEMTVYNSSKGLVLKFLNMETLLQMLIESVEKSRFNDPVARKELEDEAVKMFLEKSPGQDPEQARQIVKFWHNNRTVFYKNVIDQFLYKA